MADKLTPEQFKRWKNHPVGKVFFKHLLDYKESRERDLLSVTPMNYSQEDMYKISVRLLTQIELSNDINTIKLEDIQEEEKEDEATK